MIRFDDEKLVKLTPRSVILYILQIKYCMRKDKSTNSCKGGTKSMGFQ